MNKICVKNFKQFESLIAILIICFFSFFFLLDSPLHPWKCWDVTTDSAVFKLVSFLMRKGYIPYRDTFDHKGPLLYIINFIGDNISTYKGVWIVEFFSLAITFFFVYKTARIITTIEYSIISTLVASSLLFLYFDGGNYSEEYAMPFIAISLYYFTKYFLLNTISRLGLILCGFSFGCVLMLRVNMISLWIVMCIAVLTNCIIKNEFQQLFIFLAWFSFGMGLILLPIFLWLYINNALIPFWNDYVLFNFMYSSKMSSGSTLNARTQSFFTFYETPILILVSVSMFYLLKAKKSIYNYAYILYILITLLFICISGQSYMHYGMILIPSIVYPIAGISSYLSEIILDERIYKPLMTLVCIYLLSTFVIPAWIGCFKSVPSYYISRHDDGRSEIGKKISSLICSYVDENEPISVYGNWDYMYVLSNRIPASKYSYQYPIGTVNPAILDEYFDQISESLPTIIVIKNGYYDDRITSFLENHSYTLLWPEENEIDIEKTTSVYILENKLISK